MALKDDFADIVGRVTDITEIEDKITAVSEALSNAENISDLKSQLETAKNEVADWKNKYAKKWDEALRSEPITPINYKEEEEITFENIDILFDGRTES